MHTEHRQINHIPDHGKPAGRQHDAFHQGIHLESSELPLQRYADKSDFRRRTLNSRDAEPIDAS